MVLVKRGSRSNQVCDKCGSPIPSKVPHYRVGGAPYKRRCQACGSEKDEVTINASAETPEPEFENTHNPIGSIRGPDGRFIPRAG